MTGMVRKERHEYLDDDGWYHTGDQGSLRGPYVFFTGRIKDLIKTSGANVAPREVEAVINQSPGVMTSIVVGVPDAHREEIVRALVAPRRGVDLSPAALTAHCRSLLSPYKVPRRIAVICEEEFPLNSTGKAIRAEACRLILSRGVQV
jgi:acyl-CoA synthetase (AMP-forming)/AMP-acid ligase II